MPVLLDIEGTVCPISFVHDVLFPYAVQRAEIEIPKLEFPLRTDSGELASYLLAFPKEYQGSADKLITHIKDLVAQDVKIGYLKALEGYLWKSGYESGEIKAPLFKDVPNAMHKWAADDKVYIYSSGSVPAQKMLFSYTNSGDLTKIISGYYDTQNAGPKMDSESYIKIAKDLQLKPEDIHFFSDSPNEIDSAHKAGLRTTFVVRPGNPEFTDYHPPMNTTTTFAL